MISKVKLNKVDENLVQVVDNSEYDYSLLPTKFLRENTISINYLQKITSDDTKVKKVYLSEHDSLEETVFEISEDGYYRVNHLIIPTREWLEKADLENIIKFDKVYFYMNEDVYEYNFRNKQATKVDPIILLGVCDLKTTVFYSEEDFVSIYNLKKCLIDFINDKFSKQNCKEKRDTTLNTKLEYLHMVYNVLDYYISCGNFIEAQNLLEEYSRCYDICKETKTSKCNCI